MKEKPKFKDIADYFGTTTTTLYNWRVSDKREDNRRYKAFEDYYKKQKKIND